MGWLDSAAESVTNGLLSPVEGMYDTGKQVLNDAYQSVINSAPAAGRVGQGALDAFSSGFNPPPQQQSGLVPDEWRKDGRLDQWRAQLKAANTLQRILSAQFGSDMPTDTAAIMDTLRGANAWEGLSDIDRRALDAAVNRLIGYGRGQQGPSIYPGNERAQAHWGEAEPSASSPYGFLLKFLSRDIEGTGNVPNAVYKHLAGPSWSNR